MEQLPYHWLLAVYVGVGYLFGAAVIAGALLTHGIRLLSVRGNIKPWLSMTVQALNAVLGLGSVLALAWLIGCALPKPLSEFGSILSLVVAAAVAIGGISMLNSSGLLSRRDQ
jgi:hypothetical protein